MSKLFHVLAEMRSQDTLTAALACASMDIKILPIHGIIKGCCTCGRLNCSSPGKHPIAALAPNGEKNATTDRSIIRQWFKRYPHANIAGVVPDGIAVIDIDGADGKRSLATLGELPRTPRVFTGRGFHLYFSGEIKTKIGWQPGIDLKGGGYAMLPPSMHLSGKRYRWSNRADVLAPLPAVFAQIVNKKGKSAGIITKGRRNDGLFRTGCWLHHRQVPEDIILEALKFINARCCLPPLDEAEIKRIAASATSYETDIEGIFEIAANIEAEPVSWLWHPYLPRGCVTMLEGDPGIGKSYITMDLAARVSSGGVPPLDGKRFHQGKVLILNAEDDPARTIVPRLMALDARMDQIVVQKKFVPIDDRGLDMLRKVLTEHRPNLVIIDPLVAYMGGDIDLHRANETTVFMTELDELAREFDVAIVAVRHLVKGSREKAIYRGVGSIGIVARARSALLVGTPPGEGEGVMAMAHSKHNLVARGVTLLYRIVGGGRDDLPRLQWEGTSSCFADELDQLAGPADRGRPPNQREDAMAFLKAYLAETPRPWDDVVREGEARGHSDSTLRRARKDICEVVKMNGRPHWKLKT